MKSHVSSCVPAAKNIRSDSRVLLEINISHASPVLLLPQLEWWVKMLGASICRRQASVDWAPFTRLLIRNNMTGWLFYGRANSSDHDSIFCDGNNLLTIGAGKRLWMLNSFTYYNVNPFKMWSVLSWKESLSRGSMDLNNFAQNHAFLSQLNFLYAKSFCDSGPVKHKRRWRGRAFVLNLAPP